MYAGKFFQYMQNLVIEYFVTKNFCTYFQKKFSQICLHEKK